MHGEKKVSLKKKDMIREYRILKQFRLLFHTATEGE